MGRFWQVVWTSYFTRQNLPTRETKTLVVTGILRVLSKASITESRLLTAVVPMRESNRIWQDLSIESLFAGTDCPRNSSLGGETTCDSHHRSGEWTVPSMREL